MRINWLPDVLRDAGLQVELYDGWSARGSESWGPLTGVICHATASSRNSTPAGDCRVLWVTGSNTAPAPIAQLYLSRQGVFTVGATGKCNHVLTAKVGPQAGHGNSNLIGIEAANDDRGEPWSDVQLDAYVRGVGAICKHMGWSETVVAGHKEHQPGDKVDPTFDMNWFRSQVGLWLTNNYAGGDVPLYFTSSASQPTRGDYVTDIQQDMGALGLVIDDAPYTVAEADGIYGPRTAKALLAAIHPWVGGDPTGFSFGPGERRELKRAVARSAKADAPPAEFVDHTHDFSGTVSVTVSGSGGGGSSGTTGPAKLIPSRAAG